MSFKGQWVTLLAACELYHWIKMRDTMTSQLERPQRNVKSEGGVGGLGQNMSYM